MDINNITQLTDDQFTDIFATDPKASLKEDGTSTGFKSFGGEPIEVDILPEGGTKEEKQENKDVIIEDNKEDNKGEGKKEDLSNPDLFSEEKEEKKPGRKPKYDFSDLAGYFEDRLKTGKFVAIEEETDTGEKRKFIPKTPEEFDEVIELQVDYQLNQKVKDLEENWYKSKSPAWQAVAKYAEMADDPSEIVPFIQGVKKFEDISSYDPSTIEGAEKIVKFRLSQMGDDEDIINEQIEALKTTDKLLSTAARYKPMILNDQQAHLKSQLAQKEKEEREWTNLVHSIREGAIKSIESPLFGKHKLKQDEKLAVFNLIGIPSQESQGYQIYNAIDKLFENGDFDTLKEVALLLTKKDSYITYVSEIAATKTAQEAQRKLRIASEMKSSRTSEEEEEKVIRPQSFGSTGFGRYR